jgi:transposase
MGGAHYLADKQVIIPGVIGSASGESGDMTDFYPLSREELIDLLTNSNGLLDAALTTIEAQQAQIVALTERIKELENRLKKDSHNSNLPPSSDGLAKKPKPKSERGSSGRNSGGQKGHRGRTLEFVDQPNEVIIHTPDCCGKCGASLADEPTVLGERRQIFDLPPMSVVVTEHQVHSRCCPGCGCENRATFPENVDHPIEYGPRVKALATYLMTYQLLPMERTAKLFSELFGIHLSEGTLANAMQQASCNLADTEAAVREALANADVLHVDETGVRIEGKLNWLHVASTPKLTFYASHPKRGAVALNAINILPGFDGRAIHDGWSPYQKYGCRHGLCNAHHLRELTAIEEQFHQPWAKDMKELLLDIKQAVDLEKDRNMHRLHPLKECEFEARYRAVLKAGHAANPPPAPTGKRGRTKNGPARSLLLRLDERQSEVLAFMYDFTVPFDNNLAERDLRMMKVKQKVSGCFRSEEGAKAFCRIRGYASTMLKQGQNILSALQSVFAGRPIMPATD